MRIDPYSLKRIPRAFVCPSVFKMYERRDEVNDDVTHVHKILIKIQIVRWLASEVVTCGNLSQRAEVIKRFIMIANVR